MKRLVACMFIGVLVSLVGCEAINNLSTLTSLFGGTAQTGTNNTTEDVPTNIGAAIAAIFSGGDQNSAPFAAPSINPEVGSTCRDFADDSESNGPDGIDVSASVTAGTYGATTAAITITADDDCESDSTSDDSFAAFEIAENIPAICENGTVVTLLPGSAGVYRNNETEGHFPEIYGTFNLSDDDGNVFEDVACTIFLDGNETVLEATCEDESGNEIEVDTGDTSCQFQTS